MVVMAALLILRRFMIERRMPSRRHRSMDMNPSMSAGFITSDIATVKKRLDGLKNFVWNWINWRTQTDLIMPRGKYVSAPTVCGYSTKQTTASVGTRQRRQRTLIIQRCAKNFDERKTLSRLPGPHTSLSFLSNISDSNGSGRSSRSSRKGWRSSTWWHDQSSSSEQGWNSS